MIINRGIEFAISIIKEKLDNELNNGCYKYYNESYIIDLAKIMLSFEFDKNEFNYLVNTYEYFKNKEIENEKN